MNPRVTPRCLLQPTGFVSRLNWGVSSGSLFSLSREHNKMAINPLLNWRKPIDLPTVKVDPAIKSIPAVPGERTVSGSLDTSA